MASIVAGENLQQRREQTEQQTGKTGKTGKTGSQQNDGGSSEVNRNLVEKLKNSAKIKSVMNKLMVVRKNWMQYQSCFSADDTHVHDRLFKKFLETHYSSKILRSRL